MPKRVVPLLLAVALIAFGGVSMVGAQEAPAQQPPKETPAQEAQSDEAQAEEAQPQQATAQESAQSAEAQQPAAQQLQPAPQPPAPQPAIQQPAVPPPPVKEPISYERVPRKAKLFIEGDDTVDASNSKNKAKYGDFTTAIAAALTKKKVPVIVVTDPARADFLVRHTSSAKEDSTGTKIAKIALMGGLWGSSKFEASIMVVDKASTGIVFSYNVKKGNFQSAAEAFAKHLNNHIAGKE